MDRESIRRLNLAEIKPINDPTPKKQSLKEWAMAGGGVPESHKGREDVWHKKSANAAERHFSTAGAVKSLAKNVMKAVASKAAKADAKSLIKNLPNEGSPYVTTQEGAFYRINPKSSGSGKQAARGNIEARGGGTEPAGRSSRSNVPKPYKDETFEQITSEGNAPLDLANSYSMEHMGSPYSLPSMQESSLAKQSAIGRTYNLAATEDPAYKKAVFEAYAKSHPEIIEQSGAKNYDELVDKAYRQLILETDRQFNKLPIGMSFHRAGEGNYKSSAQMAHDVHKNKHLYVYQGGEPHPSLNAVDPSTGLNANEKFRAIHDYFGHAVHGFQFGPKGEELAFLAHSQTLSPLARMAMTTETRGANSVVNYTPLNAELKKVVSRIEEELLEAKRRGRENDVMRLQDMKSQVLNEFQYAPQKSLILPPEFTSSAYEGGMPEYIQSLIIPEAGTTVRTPMTHFSHSPDIQMTDPARYGSGIAGAESSRLSGAKNAVVPRTYFYAGEPSVVKPEVGLGPYRYRAEGESLYDLSEDPLNFRTLSAESNRAPLSARSNAGVINRDQSMSDLERMIKEYGYEGYLSSGRSPAAAVFNPKPVVKMAEGGEIHMARAGAVKGLVKGALEAVAPKAAKASQAAKPAVEAPTIMLPSSLSDLQKKVIDKKGAYGGKRVQRAADEIPRLDQKYTQDALSQAFLGDNAKALMTMDPADFEKYAATLASYHMDPNSVRYTSSGKSINYPEYMSDYLPNVGAFNDVPFLQIDKQEAGLPLMPFISGHEGRHRSRVMAAKGKNTGLVQLLPSYRLREDLPRRSQEEYIEALKRELEMTGNKVEPQRYFDDSLPKNLLIERPPIDLPDVYAKGGEVHMREGGDFEIPVKSRTAKSISDALYKFNDIATRKADGSKDELVEGFLDFIGTPSIAKAAENYAYGFPNTTGSGQTLRMRPELEETVLAVAPLAQSAGKLALKGAKAGTKALGKGATAAGRYVEDAAQRSLDEMGSASPFVTFSNMMPDTKMGIIKKGGGEWKKGSIDERLEDVKRYDTSTPEQRQYRVKLYDKYLASGEITPEEHAAAIRETLAPPAVNRFVDKKLAPYVRNQMGTAEDPIRLLADEGVTHFSPLVQRVFGGLDFSMEQGKRAAGGFPAEGVAQTPLGKLWENVSDSSIRINPASKVYGGQELPPYLQPNTPVHSAGLFDKLGFDSLTTQLEQDLLSGRITPEKLDKLTVPDVVRRVHQVEQEKQAAELAENIAAGKNMTTYAPATTEGSRWVKLEKPGDFARESDAMGHSVRGYEPEVGHPDHIKASGNQGSGEYGHGGWEAIKSGDAGVISLRDANNKSHATIEFENYYINPTEEENINALRQSYEEAAERLGQPIRFANPNDAQPEVASMDLHMAADDLYQKKLNDLESRFSDVPDVTQIKGKGNDPLTEEARQQTKDLLNSKPFGKIYFRDLKNNGLYDTQSMRRGTFNEMSQRELDLLVERLYGGVDPSYEAIADGKKKLYELIDQNKFPRIVTEEEIVDALRNATEASYAAGGEVHMSTAGAVKDAVKALMKGASKMAKPKAQKVLPAEEAKANLDSMLSSSHIKDRLYHITPKSFKQFQGKGFNPKISGNATWLSTDPENIPAWHNVGNMKGEFREGVNVMPVHVQAKSPLMLDDEGMLDWARSAFANGNKEFPELLPDSWLNAVKEGGYDSIVFHPKGDEGLDFQGKQRSPEIIMLEPNKIKSAIGNRGTYDLNNPDINKAEGGEVHMSKAGSVKNAVKGAAGALAKAFKSDRYLPDVHYADPLKPPTMKMSEALGNSGSEGKILRLTEADRSRVFGPNRGGVGFSALQHYSEPHKNVRTVWGFGNETTTRKKINQNDPENTVWSTYAGSPTQHKSNTVVIKDAIKTLQAANKAGQVHPEQIKMINERIRQAVTGDKGKEKFLFPDSFDITDPDALSLAGTFDRRAVISDALMGVGVKGPMKSVAFRQANPDAFFTDASQLESILARETDPALMNASTYDVGPHLFIMDNGIIHRPDLNEAFPYQVTGDDLGFRFEPTPIRIAAPDFTMNVPLDEAINSYKMSRGNPSQLITEEYLTNLQKRGYADGGTVKASKKKGGLASLSRSKRG